MRLKPLRTLPALNHLPCGGHPKASAPMAQLRLIAQDELTKQAPVIVGDHAGLSGRCRAETFRECRRYQLSTYAFADESPYRQTHDLPNLAHTRNTSLLKAQFIYWPRIF